MNRIRCAIYTRKSSEDGLEQEFNSLDAQREACASYVSSQKHEGWVLLTDAYDDGGLSGGSLERPALQRLLDDVGAGRVDQIIVYKIDRLTRSLSDFAKIVDILDAAEASFVSVTQSFNTATSMGRLTLNMLLSFAQFEREMTAERIRDKIAASKRKGLWMGGNVPLGFDADGRTLKIKECEAATIRVLYDLYEQLGTVRAVRDQAEDLGLRTRLRKTSAGKVSGGGNFDRGHIYQILINPIYAGRIRHKDKSFEGQHAALIDPDRWEAIQTQLKEGAAKTRRKKRGGRVSLLCGKLFDETGDRLTPSHTKTSAGTRLRYYISHRLVARSGEANLDGWRLPAKELETKVEALVRSILSVPGFAASIAPQARADDIGAVQLKVSDLLTNNGADQLLDLIERVDVAPGELTVILHGTRIARATDFAEDAICDDALIRTFPFQLRKRGVETRLILADSASGIDEALIMNIAKAHNRFGQIKSGRTFAEIAEAETASKRRIQQTIDLAFLAPDIVRDVLQGKQPLGFTSDWCLRHSLSADWTEQRSVLATL